MNYKEAVRTIKNGDFYPVYLVYGEQLLLKDEFLRRLLAALLPDGGDFDLGKFDAKEQPFFRVLDFLETGSLFSSRGRVAVVYDVPYFRSQSRGTSKDEMEAVTAYLENPDRRSHVIFLADDKPDQRRKVFICAKNNGLVVSCQALSFRETVKWLCQKCARDKKRLDREAAALMVNTVGRDLMSLRNEADKLISYVGSKDSITIDDVSEVMGRPLEFDIFELVDSVVARDSNRALTLLRGMLKSGESPHYLLYMIGRQFKLLTQVKILAEDNKSAKEIAGMLGSHPYPVEKCLKISPGFTDKRLNRSIDLIARYDLMTKTGEMSPELAVEFLTLELCLEN